jgi:hypothetical protein
MSCLRKRPAPTGVSVSRHPLLVATLAENQMKGQKRSFAGHAEAYHWTTGRVAPEYLGRDHRQKPSQSGSSNLCRNQSRKHAGP